MSRILNNLFKIFSNIFVITAIGGLFILWVNDISHQWSFLLTIWFVITIALLNKVRKLSSFEQKIFISIVYIYPISETIIKYLIFGNFIPYSWNWLNRIEHGLWAFSAGFLLYPIIKSSLVNLSYWAQALFFVSLICFIGNLNEIFEFSQRMILNDYLISKLGLFYWDTIYDLILNVIGAILGFIMIKFMFKLKDKRYTNVQY